MVVENARLHNSLSRGNYVMVKKVPLVLAITVIRPQLCSRNNSWPARPSSNEYPISFASSGAVGGRDRAHGDGAEASVSAIRTHIIFECYIVLFLPCVGRSSHVRRWHAYPHHHPRGAAGADPAVP